MVLPIRDHLRKSTVNWFCLSDFPMSRFPDFPISVHPRKSAAELHWLNAVC
jgi:hypothetical protein